MSNFISDWCTKINNIYCGPFPKQNDVDYLEKYLNVQLFIDLTYEHEKNTGIYIVKGEYINYPIKDNNIPENIIDFILFLNNICRKIFQCDGSIYLHCKGGRNRSNMVLIILNCIINKVSKDDSINEITELYNSRKMTKLKYDTIPYIDSQQNFIDFIFKEEICINNNILSLEYEHYIEYKKVKYKNSLNLIDIFKNTYNKNDLYVIILNYKFKMFPEFKKQLFLTCFSKKIYYYDQDYISILLKYRNKLYNNPYINS